MREKIGLWISSRMANDPYNKEDEKKTANKAIFGFAFGIASIVLLVAINSKNYKITNDIRL